jgi:hypothetical protein
VEQILAKGYIRGIVPWALVLGVSSVLFIAIGSPIFRILGFEYSAISALLLSLACGFLTASRVSVQMAGVARNLVAGILLWSIPLLISTISILFVSNCAYWDGLLFYLEIALPTTLLATIFGSSIGSFAGSRRIAIILFAAFWLVTFIISLIPGYIFPQLFTYGWQYGFFPGLIWDEYIELGSGYAWHLVEWGLLATMMLLLASNEVKAFKWVKLVAVALLYCGLLLNRSNNRIVTSHEKVKESLLSTLDADYAKIHFYGASLTHDERSKLKFETMWYLHDIRTRLGLKDTSAVDIYVYPDVESLYRLVGTRSASIAKPWLSELHIAKENLHSLRHELVHVLLREWGSFPFNASWSTGMTEGVAMAIEPNYDGMHTLHEHASAIMRMKLADGVQRVMSFTGFASGASTTSYVLAGSFSKFLLDHYPASKFAAAYTTLNFGENYGKTLTELEREWKAEIMPLSAKMDHFDSLRAEFYFRRSSIIYQPCLRRMGKLSSEAQKAMKAHLYEKAGRLYSEIHRESGSIASFRGMLSALLRDGKIDSARRILYANPMSTHPQRLSLYLMRGDLISPSYYDTLIASELSSASVITSFVRKNLGFSADYVYQQYASSSPLAAIPLDMTEASYTTPQTYQYLADVLTAQAYEDEGMYMNAMFFYDKAVKKVTQDSTADAIRWPLILSVMSIDPLFFPPDKPTRPAWIAEFDDHTRMREYFEKRSRNSHTSVK